MTRQQRDKILPTSQGDRAGERLPSTESWTDLAKKYALMTTGAGTGTTLSGLSQPWILNTGDSTGDPFNPRLAL